MGALGLIGILTVMFGCIIFLVWLFEPSREMPLWWLPTWLVKDTKPYLSKREYIFATISVNALFGLPTLVALLLLGIMKLCLVIIGIFLLKRKK